MRKVIVAAIALAVSLPLSARTECRMTFSVSGWSAFYKTSTGTGKIRCSNGQKANVIVSSKGGGFSFGRAKIQEGIGKFTDVRDIRELFGSYVQGEAPAGAGKSVKASVLTKGEVVLSLVGKGSGVNLGFSLGKFTIDKAGR